MMLRPLAVVLLLAGLPAQDDRQFAPVRLMQLGPLPADAQPLQIGRDGTLVSDLAEILTARPAEVVLEVDRRTPAAVVGAVVEQCHAAGIERVLFTAVLPGREEKGCFTLVLPAPDADGDADLELRMHREGPGVPPDSLGVHMRRIVTGFEALEKRHLRLAAHVPGNGAFEPALQALSAVARAGVSQVLVQWQRTDVQERVHEASPGDLSALGRAEPARPGNFALTLGPSPLLHVSPLAVPLPRPEVSDEAVGFLRRMEPGPPEEPRGGAGGRYGGRGGGFRAEAIQQAITAGLAWLAQEQDPSGVWRGADGEPDLEATSLALLAFLGDGQTLIRGPHAESLCRGIGALMARQGPQGRIGLPGKGAVRRHALAAYALVEAFGLTYSPVMRGHVQDAIAWLEGQRLPDGGWNDGQAGAPGDTLSTAWSHSALMSALFFRIPVQADVGDLGAWYDEVVDHDSGAHRLHAGDEAESDPETAFTITAAALFCRFFIGQDPKAKPIMAKAGDLLLSLGAGKEAVADPLRSYFTTYALYQMGGRHWKAWSKVLQGELSGAQEKEGADAGSWPPPAGDSRVTTTALRVLTLQAYYRYTRLVR